MCEPSPPDDPEHETVMSEEKARRVGREIGARLAANLSGRPEPVLTERQWREIQRGRGNADA